MSKHWGDREPAPPDGDAKQDGSPDRESRCANSPAPAGVGGAPGKYADKDREYETPEFMTRLQAGDEKAWEALVAHFRPVLWKTLADRFGGAIEPADVLQSTWIRMFRAITGCKFKVGARLFPFLVKVATNCAYTLLRETGPGQSGAQPSPEPDAGEGPADPLLPEDTASLEQCLSQKGFRLAHVTALAGPWGAKGALASILGRSPAWMTKYSQELCRAVRGCCERLDISPAMLREILDAGSPGHSARA